MTHRLNRRQLFKRGATVAAAGALGTGGFETMAKPPADAATGGAGL